MNSNSNLMLKDHFTIQTNLFPQTSTFLSSIIHNPFPPSPSLKLSFSSQKEPMFLYPNPNNSIPSSTGRCLNFDNVLSGSDYDNKFEFTPFQLNSGSNNRKDMGQTPTYLFEKLKPGNMEVEVSDFTAEENPIDNFQEANANHSFQGFLQKVEISQKGNSASETKHTINDNYPEPKRKNPSFTKPFKRKERILHSKIAQANQRNGKGDHLPMPMPLTHFTRSNSDVPPTLESNLGYGGAKEGSLGDNKYLNNLKDNKGVDKNHHNHIINNNNNHNNNHHKPNDLQAQFEIFQSHCQKSKFAKNLFADFNNNAEGTDRGLFQIPEKNLNFESEFTLEQKNGPNFDQNIEFEIENNNDQISKLLDFGSETSREFEMEENKVLAAVFNSAEKASPQREAHFLTPTKDFLFDDKRCSEQKNIFSSITAKKKTPQSKHFSDFMNSTNITDPSITDFLSTRKGELTTSSRKEQRVKQRPITFSRFENDYEILETLGSNDFGTVFKCQHKLDGLIYAIKCIQNKNKGENGNNQVFNEAHALASLSALDENPFIVRYYNAWIEDDKLYLVMEHCQNNLRKIRAELTKFSESRIRQIMRDICTGLKFLHNQDIFHLGLKPENILYSMTRKYKIADLGLSKIAHSSFEREITEGDCRYTAPELLSDFIEGDVSDFTKADIYSFGVIIYELMIGSELTRNGQDWIDIRNGNLHRLDHLNYSNSLKSIVRAMTSSNPQQRPSAAELMANFLQSEIELELKWEKKENKVLKKQIKELEGQLNIKRKNSM